MHDMFGIFQRAGPIFVYFVDHSREDVFQSALRRFSDISFDK